MLGRPDPLGTPGWLRWCSPLTALLVAAVAGLFWRTGVRHYRSTGS
jgi:ABC-2 type transport system permease protein